MVQFCKNVDGIDISGNHSLAMQVNKTLMESAKPGDCIFVAFDNVGESVRTDPKTGKKYSFDAGDFIKNTQIKCKNANVGFIHTTYYCFEEILLSYLGLLELCEVDGKGRDIIKTKGLYDAVKYVRECIYNGEEYYTRKNEHVKYVIGLKADANRNKEHFADALLYQATRNLSHGKFMVSKEKNGFGKCWIADCDQIKMGSKEFNCSNCQYRMKGHCSLDKALDIDQNSLLSLYRINLRYLRDNL